MFLFIRPFCAKYFPLLKVFSSSRDSLVGIATDCWLDGPGFETLQVEKDSLSSKTLHTGSGAQTASN